MTEDTNTNGGADNDGRMVTLNVAGLGEQGEEISTTEADAAIGADQVDHPAAKAFKAAQAQLTVKTSELLTGYHDKISAIRDDNGLEDGPYTDHLSDQQKSEIIQARKREAADELHKNTVAEYEAAFEEYAQQAERHANELRTALFGLGENGSAALAQAINADEDQLMRMITLSDLTGVTTIGRAAFSAAVTRGDAPGVVLAYLGKNPEAAALLHAYEQAPTAEWISTQKANISRLIQPPTFDQLTSRPQVRPY